MNLYQDIIRPILFKTTTPEGIHHLALNLLAHTSIAHLFGPSKNQILRPIKRWGLDFRNPIGLAAGFDKNAEAIKAWYELGFGFIEIGTVTRHAQPGNPQPRIFRYPTHKALINRMGFPNEGADKISSKLENFLSTHSLEKFPIGVNFGKSKVTELDQAAEDYLYTFDKFSGLGDFFVINVSSPNTPGLRELQNKEMLSPILDAVQSSNKKLPRKKPLLLKIAPDLNESQIDDILDMIQEFELDGIVATNTTLARPHEDFTETGGLSGLPVRESSTKIIRYIHEKTAGKLTIVGAGGVFTKNDFEEKMEAGSSLVETYTGFIYQGPQIAAKILS